VFVSRFFECHCRGQSVSSGVGQPPCKATRCRRTG
jgi:hypothetical protein